ncbi:MAG: MFS transporter [Firmicutes bacterium]|nr:MFS transporter [Bacillota bacterium]
MNSEGSLKKYTLLIATLNAFMTPFMGNAINLAIPSLGQEYGSSALLLNWVVNGYLMATAAFLLPFGRLADIVGRKRVFLAGIASFSIFSLGCGFAWSIEALILFRVLQGIGGAMVFSTSMAILTSVFPPQDRGRVLGISTAATYTGLSLGPVLGGAMTKYLGWESIFFLSVLFGVAVLLLTVFKLKGEWVGAPGEEFDLLGSMLYAVGIIGLIYGFSSIATSAVAKYLLGFGIAALIGFIVYQYRSKNPILNIRLFKGNPAFTLSNLAALINYSATFAVTYLMSNHLQVVLGFDSPTAGLILLSQPIMMALLSPFAGRLSDRVEPRIVSSWGMGITTLGLLMFAFLNHQTPVWGIVATLMLLGTGFALFSSPNSNAVMSAVEKRFYGVASSILGTMRLTGQAISMALVSMIIAMYMGSVMLSPEYADLLVRSTRAAFLCFTFICFIGVFASLARGNIRKDPK